MYSPIGVDNNGKLNTLGGDAVQAIVEQALEESPAGGSVTLVESPAGSGLYEIQGV